MRQRTSWSTADKAVLGFVALTIAPFVRAATASWFWQPEHRMAPVATAVFFVVVFALVVGRYRWAWVIIALFELVGFIGWLIDPTSVRAVNIPWLITGIGSFALLLSPTMRDRLRAPVRVPHRFS